MPKDKSTYSRTSHSPMPTPYARSEIGDPSQSTELPATTSMSFHLSLTLATSSSTAIHNISERSPSTDPELFGSRSSTGIESSSDRDEGGSAEEDDSRSSNPVVCIAPLQSTSTLTAGPSAFPSANTRSRSSSVEYIETRYPIAGTSSVAASASFEGANGAFSNDSIGSLRTPFWPPTCGKRTYRKITQLLIS
ncbi:hypothetical protein BCR39DRAFT_561886 [Naematelia encephala]|uniref:Uncharacterized protein n=1 Tax=Naematelia encephala TaxID=71784 RepID=A0A1Y2AMA0_9TREE|nr:hypothetical protein BCR39DRAFT_561886 [Naematelia encephala]